MKKMILSIFIIGALLFTGCGGGNSNSNNGVSSNGTKKDHFKIQKVSYTLNGSDIPSCLNASSITTSKAQKSDDIGVQICQWLCGDYEGARPVSVSLSFSQYGKNSVWEFDNDVITTAPDNCHN